MEMKSRAKDKRHNKASHSISRETAGFFWHAHLSVTQALQQQQQQQQQQPSLDPGALVTGHLCSDEPATREAWRQKCEKEGYCATNRQRGRPWNHDKAIAGLRRGGVHKGGRYALIARKWLRSCRDVTRPSQRDYSHMR